MKKRNMVETPTKRICRPAMPPEKVVCGDRRNSIPDGTPIQPFPTDGQLYDNLDLPKSELESRIDQLPGKIRSYKMTSVTLDEAGLLQQEGSGPNYQGGCLTLCTCQGMFRAEKKNPDEWLEDWWIAGVTTRNLCGRIWLFYLAKIEKVYASQSELWRAHTGKLRQAKSTRRNPLGDAYQPDPASACQDVFDAAHYHPPMVGHNHHVTASHDCWKNDIEFFPAPFKRHPVLLVAKPKLTFLWQTPLLFLDDHPRNKTWDGVKPLFQNLRMSEGIEMSGMGRNRKVGLS